MRYLSVCSGIEAATVAWRPLGWEPLAFSEIDTFPCAVLAHYYPDVPNYGDLTQFHTWPDLAADILIGGTPCQAFSVAGLRKGLSDPRGNLALTYLGVADRYRPRWLVWENVPGVLSSGRGRDFGAFLGALAQIGYGFAYRVLDAQYFGLAQRRARVFVVGYLGDWRRAAAVLFERESLSGHPAPRREAGQDTAGSTGDGVARCLTVGEAVRQDWETCNLIAHSLRADGFDASEDGTGRGTPIVPMAFDARQSDVIQYGEKTGPLDTDGTTPPLKANLNGQGTGAGPSVFASIGMQVRRLTPRECERLQGFPDDYTLIPYRGKPAADGPRYKALGNSMAVPVIAWLGERILLTDAGLLDDMAYAA